MVPRDVTGALLAFTIGEMVELLFLASIMAMKLLALSPSVSSSSSFSCWFLASESLDTRLMKLFRPAAVSLMPKRLFASPFV
jgi:hypothetical protein